MNRSRIIIITLLCGMLLLFGLGITMGSASIPIGDTLNGLFGKSGNAVNQIISEIRLPRTITACLAGMALAASGLMMQTLFSNPLAGPFILGISSGASLLVALVTISIGGSALVGLGLPAVAMLGAIGSALLILLASVWIRNPFVLLIVGVMMASFSAAIVSVLQYFADPESLKTFVIWSMGDFGMVQSSQLPVFGSLTGLALIGSVICIKPLNAYLLGENYIQSLGLNLRLSRLGILLVSAVLAGTVTAYCGPVAFIGLAVPNLVRFIVRTANHGVMLPVTILAGGCIGLICDIIARLPGYDLSLPINAISAIIGAPVVIAVLIRNRKSQFS